MANIVINPEVFQEGNMLVPGRVIVNDPGSDVLGGSQQIMMGDGFSTSSLTYISNALPKIKNGSWSGDINVKGKTWDYDWTSPIRFRFLITAPRQQSGYTEVPVWLPDDGLANENAYTVAVRASSLVDDSTVFNGDKLTETYARPYMHQFTHKAWFLGNVGDFMQAGYYYSGEILKRIVSPKMTSAGKVQYTLNYDTNHPYSTVLTGQSGYSKTLIRQPFDFTRNTWGTMSTSNYTTCTAEFDTNYIVWWKDSSTSNGSINTGKDSTDRASGLDYYCQLPIYTDVYKFTKHARTKPVLRYSVSGSTIQFSWDNDGAGTYTLYKVAR